MKIFQIKVVKYFHIEIFVVAGLCKCSEESSQCLALYEDVSQVICYCQEGGLVDINVPCNRDIPLVILILLVIGCIVVAAIFGLICMCVCKCL